MTRLSGTPPRSPAPAAASSPVLAAPRAVGPEPRVATPHGPSEGAPLAPALARVAGPMHRASPARAQIDPARTRLSLAELAARVPADALSAHLEAFTRSTGAPARDGALSLVSLYREAARGHFGLAAERPITYAAFRAHLASRGLAGECERLLDGLPPPLRARLFRGEATPVELLEAHAVRRGSWQALEVPVPYAEVLRAARADGSLDALRAVVAERSPRTRRAVEAGLVAPVELARWLDEARLRTSDVLVIGAGMAGLAAAQELQTQGLRVTVLEARDRVGGRTHTDHDALGVPFDVGAAWLHGAADNPLTAITEQLGFTTRADDAPHLAYGAGDPKAAGHAYEAALEATRERWSALEADQPLSNAGVVPGPWGPAAAAAMAEGSLGTSQAAGSSRDWQSIHPEIGDKLVAEGLGTVVASFAHGVPIKLSTAVRKIEWGDEGVVVTAGGQRYRAEKLVITVPTGVLASGQIEFDPPLPAWKQAAIEALPMGQFEKVALTFERGALPEVPAATHVAPLDADARVGDLPMELVLRPFDSDAVVGFVGGDVARTLAEQGREAAIDRAVDRLARMYGDGVRTQVLRSFVTEWGQDPWARGAYSAAKPGLAHMRERLAKPVDDTLYFAGEAAHVEWAQCVPGAYLTGRDAGRAIAERLAAVRARLGAA